MSIVMVLIVFLIPGLLGILAVRSISEDFYAKHRIPAMAIGFVAPHIVLFSLLTLAMGRFDILQSSVRFKALYCLLGVILDLFVIACSKYKTKIAVLYNSDTILACIVVACFLCFTYFLYIPTYLVIHNMDDFGVKLISCVEVFAMEFVLTVILMVCLRVLLNRTKRIKELYMVLIFCIGICIYIQYNFLNRDLPTLAGNQIDWTAYSGRSIVGAIIWLVILLVMLLLFFTVDRIRLGKILLFISASLIVMQTVSLIAEFRGYLTNLKVDESSQYSTDGEYQTGDGHNVVVFIVDTLDAAQIDAYLESEYYKGEWSDFDYFDNVVAGGAATRLGGPALFTGIEYDPYFDETVYFNYAYDNDVLDSFSAHGYDVRLFSRGEMGRYETLNFKGIDSSVIDNKSSFVKAMSGLVNYCVVPYALKERYYFGTEEIIRSLNDGTSRYNSANDVFYRHLKEYGHLDVEYDKTFRLYHLYGVHWPYHNNELCEYTDEFDQYDDRILAGVVLEVNTYMDYLKSAGVYDNTTVIIMGDHGCKEYGLSGCRPAVLVKPDDNNKDLRLGVKEHYSDQTGVNMRIDQPYSFWNVTNFLRAIAGDEEYGMMLYETADDVMGERMHTYENAPGDGFHRVSIKAPSPDRFYSENRDNIFSVYESDTVNCTECNSGEAIVLEGKSEIDTGYELIVNVTLTGYAGGDVTLTAAYDRVYGNYQKAIIFSGRNQVYSVDILGQTDIGQFSIVIPEECIEGNVLHLRQIYPYAVISESGTEVRSVTYNSISLDYK